MITYEKARLKKFSKTITNWKIVSTIVMINKQRQIIYQIKGLINNNHIMKTTSPIIHSSINLHLGGWIFTQSKNKYLLITNSDTQSCDSQFLNGAYIEKYQIKYIDDLKI